MAGSGLAVCSVGTGMSTDFISSTVFQEDPSVVLFFPFLCISRGLGAGGSPGAKGGSEKHHHGPAMAC